MASTVIGKAFLFGEVILNIPGYRTVTHEGDFVQVLDDAGNAYLVTEAEGEWTLSECRWENANTRKLTGRKVIVRRFNDADSPRRRKPSLPPEERSARRMRDRAAVLG